MKKASINSSDFQKYFKQFMLKKIGISGQKKISSSKNEVRKMIDKANDDAEKNVIKTNQEFHNLMENRKKSINVLPVVEKGGKEIV